MNHSPEFYQAAAALFSLLTPIAYIALYLTKYYLPLH